MQPIRLTPQRRAILDVLADSPDHPTASDILDRVRERVRGVGAATVYRSLALLVQSGHVAVLRANEHDAVRYDRTVHRHDHVVCVTCGKVVDAEIPLDQRALDRLSQQLSFVITSYQSIIHGHCARCAEVAISQEETECPS